MIHDHRACTTPNAIFVSVTTEQNQGRRGKDLVLHINRRLVGYFSKGMHESRSIMKWGLAGISQRHPSILCGTSNCCFILPFLFRN